MGHRSQRSPFSVAVGVTICLIYFWYSTLLFIVFACTLDDTTGSMWFVLLITVSCMVVGFFIAMFVGSQVLVIPVFSKRKTGLVLELRASSTCTFSAFSNGKYSVV